MSAKKTKKNLILRYWLDRDAGANFSEQVEGVREQLKKDFKSPTARMKIVEILFDERVLDPIPFLPNEFVGSEEFKKYVISCYDFVGEQGFNPTRSLPAEVGRWLHQICKRSRSDEGFLGRESSPWRLESFSEELRKTYIVSNVERDATLTDLMPLLPIDRLIEDHFESLVSILLDARSIDEQTFGAVMESYKGQGFAFFAQQLAKQSREQTEKIMEDIRRDTKVGWSDGSSWLAEKAVILLVFLLMTYGALWVATPYPSDCQNAKNTLWRYTESQEIDKMVVTARRYSSGVGRLKSDEEIRQSIIRGLMPWEEERRLKKIIDQKCEKSFSSVISTFTG